MNAVIHGLKILNGILNFNNNFLLTHAVSGIINIETFANCGGRPYGCFKDFVV